MPVQQSSITTSKYLSPFSLSPIRFELPLIFIFNFVIAKAHSAQSTLDYISKMDHQETDFKPQTIARLFQTAIFEDQNQQQQVKITKNTVKLVNEYLKIFATEAILRSNEHRLQEEAEEDEEKQKQGQEDGNDADAGALNANGEDAVGQNKILDVRHLEAISGLLVLDF